MQEKIFFILSISSEHQKRKGDQHKNYDKKPNDPPFGIPDLTDKSTARPF